MALFSILSEERTPDYFPPLGSNLKVLLIWPKFPPSFWGFEGVLRMLPEAAMTPPLGLITVAALCPSSWSLRLLDRAFDAVRDEDYQWADLVMVSSMHAQRVDTLAILARARSLGKRTFIGGPWASSEPEKLQPLADHVLVGEAEEVFAEIAADLERGTARAVYRVGDKPDMSHSPIPRFDLLRREMYTSMPVQFSRGCPFQCEFCDIITIYGRKPRVKSPAQLIAELDTLRALGWRNRGLRRRRQASSAIRKTPCNYPRVGGMEVNGMAACVLVLYRGIGRSRGSSRVDGRYGRGQRHVSLFSRHRIPVRLKPLKSTKKFQNLRKDNLEQIRTIQESGLLGCSAVSLSDSIPTMKRSSRNGSADSSNAQGDHMGDGEHAASSRRPRLFYEPHEEGRPADRGQRGHFQFQRA